MYGPAIFVILVSVIILWFVYFWIKEFAWLMALDNQYFYTAHDKLIWGAAFIFIFPLAPFAFIVWKSLMTAGKNE